MSGAKKVLVFGSYAPSLVNFRGPLIAAMCARGHEVLAVGGEMDARTAAAIRELGAQPHELQVTNQSLNPFKMLRLIKDMKRLVREHRPDVLLSYTIKPVIVSALAGAAEGVPRIISMITGAGYAFAGGVHPKRLIARAAGTIFYRMALRRSDWVVFQNPDDVELFREEGLISPGQNVCRVNGSGVDLEHFRLTPQPSETSFLMVSRLLKGKGIREFGTAAARLKRQYPDVAVHLVGYRDSSPDSISEAELQKMIDSGVEFHGRLDDVRPAIAACSVYVLPSCYREGTPRSVLEAMAMGRAIITTDTPGCRETVQHGINGFLVPPRDSDALYDAMLQFVKAQGLAATMGERSRALAESKFDVRLVNAELLRVAEL
jgi:glycosyltransferase involved in cell wall biosynthesis